MEDTTTSGVRILDTRATEWRAPGPGEPFHGTKTRTKVLARARAGWPCAQMLTRSGGVSSYGDGRPERHTHRTVREWVYIVGGELPYREFTSPTDVTGSTQLYSQGYFLERVPGAFSWHGVDPARDPFGYISLEFRNGPGHAPGEAGNGDENLSLPDGEVYHGAPIPEPPRRSGYLLDVREGAAHPYSTPYVRLTDTHALKWADARSAGPIGAGSSSLRRVLAENEQGEVLFEEMLVSPAELAGVSLTIRDRELWVVLGGAASIVTSSGPRSVRQHFVLDWDAGATLRVEPDHGSAPYLHVLIWHLGRALNGAA